MKCCVPVPCSQTCYYDGSPVHVDTFDSVALVANPNNYAIAGIPNMNNANYSGLAACTLQVAGAVDNLMVFNFRYATPQDRITAIRIYTNYGSILNDNDCIVDPTAQLFDAAGAPLTAPFTASANNGGAAFTTAVPGAPVNGVAMVRLSNIHGNGAVTPVGIREVEMLQMGLGPAALIYCPDTAVPLQWVDPRTGAAVSTADLAACR